MFEVSFFSALLGGILTFLAPCTLSLIPGYIAFIGGGGVGDSSGVVTSVRQRTMWNAVLFVLGFSLVFITYGIASGAIGKFLILHRSLIAAIGGFVVIYLGLSTLHLWRLPRFMGNSSFHLPNGIGAGSRLGAFLLGCLFSLGWSPCLGPILGTILLLAATSSTILYGGALLAVYSFGLAIPFLLVAFFYGSTFAYLPALQQYLPYIQKIGGIMLIGIGLLLVIGQFGILNTWVAQILGPSLFDAMVQYV